MCNKLASVWKFVCPLAYLWYESISFHIYSMISVCLYIVQHFLLHIMCVSVATTYLSFWGENPHGKSFWKSYSRTVALLLVLTSSSSLSSSSTLSWHGLRFVHFPFSFCAFYCFALNENWNCLRDQLFERCCLAATGRTSFFFCRHSIRVYLFFLVVCVDVHCLSIQCIFSLNYHHNVT